ncbi:hypothetical protein Fmac_004514 [Flemingia macrophylla]|uniref:Uncharacterized protein n=1 Tax=Flemingia macrophylla TaxID=520843 RepID=A0ABD1N5B3_9FABA
MLSTQHNTTKAGPFHFQREHITSEYGNKEANLSLSLSLSNIKPFSGFCISPLSSANAHSRHGIFHAHLNTCFLL